MNAQSDVWTFSDPGTVNEMEKLFDAVQKEETTTKYLAGVIILIVIASGVACYFYAFQWFNKSWLLLIAALFGELIGLLVIGVAIRAFLGKNVDHEAVFQSLLEQTSDLRNLAQFIQSKIEKDSDSPDFFQDALVKVVGELASKSLGTNWEPVLIKAGFRSAGEKYAGSQIDPVFQSCAGNTVIPEKFRALMVNRVGLGAFDPLRRYNCCGGWLEELLGDFPEHYKEVERIVNERLPEDWLNPLCGGYLESYLGIDGEDDRDALVYASRLCYAGAANKMLIQNTKTLHIWFILHQTFDKQGLKNSEIEYLVESDQSIE